ARWPARGELRKRYGQAVAQRNALLSRLSAGYGSPEDLRIWDAGMAEAAAPLIEARAEAVAELAGPFATAAEELGLAEATLEYAPRAEGSAEELREGLEERREQDIRMGRSSWGPHLDELKLSAAGRSLRKYGSQGQQRTGLLALLFSEREALLAARQVTPLLLLDDVMSELDPGRRERLVARLGDGGQVLITAADEESVPAAARETVVRMPPPQTESAAA
ncbi:MAG: DNA replication/repair protein RecF, partial [Solirubrobacterales bacterium]